MESTTISKSWGGARQGAGRKSVDQSVKKVTVAFSLSPEHKARVQAAAKAAGISASELLARWIEDLA
ncbi:MAG: hypothetical protein IJ205_07380 [Bacteroidales bacterium]|nr:hypothetical protein [Bacteroidales bacterium]